MKKNSKTIAVVGLGYVGLPLALLAQKKGYKVIGIDIDEEKLELLRKNKFPFVDLKAEKELKKNPLEVTSDFSVVTEVSSVIICVPTPIYTNHLPNLEPVKSACEEIGPFIQKGQLIVLESTVNPGISETVMMPILEKLSGLKAGEDFYLAHCPERINPGDKKWNVENIPRVVGSLEKVGLEKALKLYRSIIDAEIKPMGSLQEAEAVKVVENSFRDINIAFVNELAMSFTKLKIDLVSVIEGASTKPFSFVPHYPGCGVGGHCIPVDPYYLIEYAKENGFNHDFLVLARRINNQMPQFTANLVARALNEKDIPIHGAKVAVLGLAYKPEIDDCRESPSFEIIKHLKEYGAEVIPYDPFVPSQSKAKSLENALQGTQAAVIATAHQAFSGLTPARLLQYGVKVLVDGRNFLSKEKFAASGVVYKGIGR